MVEALFAPLAKPPLPIRLGAVGAFKRKGAWHWQDKSYGFQFQCMKDIDFLML